MKITVKASHRPRDREKLEGIGFRHNIEANDVTPIQIKFIFDEINMLGLFSRDDFDFRDISESRYCKMTECNYNRRTDVALILCAYYPVRILKKYNDLKISESVKNEYVHDRQENVSEAKLSGNWTQADTLQQRYRIAKKSLDKLRKRIKEYEQKYPGIKSYWRLNYE